MFFRFIVVAVGLFVAGSAFGELVHGEKAASEQVIKDVDQALKKGVGYLLESQNKNGSWGSARRTKGLNIFAPAPGSHYAFQAGTTALALMGLLQAQEGREEERRVIMLAEGWLAKKLPSLRRVDSVTVYNVWAHAYGLRGLCALYRFHEHDRDRQERLKKLAVEQISLLQRYHSLEGGWGYFDFGLTTKSPSGHSTSFTTATVLLALDEAKEVMDLSMPEQEIKESLALIRVLQNPDNTYGYSLGHRTFPRLGINRPAGSLARSQVCNAALRVYGDEGITDEVLVTWLERLTKRDGWLSIGRKRPIPHETHFSISGYFYYYGHYYAAHCAELLPKEERGPFLKPLCQLLLEKQEKDGSWWDYPLYDYHQAYGTGYALVALSKYRKMLRDH